MNNRNCLTADLIAFMCQSEKLQNELFECRVHHSWWYSIVVRTPVWAGELSLSCARLMAGRVTTLRVRCPLSVNQNGQLSEPSLRGQLN